MSTPSYFGRAWKVQVTPQSAGGEVWTVANSTWDTESLRCTFEIEQATTGSWFSGRIEIWNLDSSAAQVIQHDDLVTVEAGYQAPGSGVVFSGRVFQPLWDRASETDNKLTLHCVFGMWEDLNSYVSESFPAGLSQADAVAQVAAAAGLTVAYLDPVLSTKTYPRGSAFAGYARRFFDQIALANHVSACWIGPDGVHIQSLTSTATTPDVIYAPPFTSTQGPTSSGGLTKYTLLGTPQQTEMGVEFTTLLDSSIKLGTLVGLNNVVVKRLPAVPMQFQTPFAKDGVYSVAGIKHSGDTRGNAWYTQVTGVFSNWDKIRMQQFKP